MSLEAHLPTSSWAETVSNKWFMSAALWAAPWCSLPQLLGPTYLRAKLLLALGQQHFSWFPAQISHFSPCHLPFSVLVHTSEQSPALHPAASSWLLRDGQVWKLQHGEGRGTSENCYPYFIVKMGILCSWSWQLLTQLVHKPPKAVVKHSP